MPETVITAVFSYIGTNIDDLFIVALLFAQTENKKQMRQIVIGKYLGIGSLILLSILFAFGLSFLPQKYIALLGIIPILLGIKEYLLSRKPSGSDDKISLKTSLLWNTVLVTAANGADNLGVYIPLFARYGFSELIAVIAIFLAMTALWCLLGKKISDLPILKRLLLQYKHIAVPAVYVLFGVYIILKGVI